VARVTVEDCLKKVPNQFELSILGAMRAQQLLNGARPLVKTDIEKLLWPSERLRLGRWGRLVKNLGPPRQSAPHDPVWVIVQIEDDFQCLRCVEMI